MNVINTLASLWLVLNLRWGLLKSCMKRLQRECWDRRKNLYQRQVDAERRDEETAAEAERRGEHRLARADALDPTAEECGRQAEAHDGDREDQDDLLQRPIVRGRFGDADQLGQRQVERREGIGLADRQMHRECGGRDQESVVARRRHRMRPIQERTHLPLPPPKVRDPLLDFALVLITLPLFVRRAGVIVKTGAVLLPGPGREALRRLGRRAP